MSTDPSTDPSTGIDPGTEADLADVAEQEQDVVTADVDPESPVGPVEPSLDSASEGDVADSLREVELPDDER